MSNRIRRLALWAGVSTTYQISALYQRDSYVGLSKLSIVISVRPWIHKDNYNVAIDAARSQATGIVGEPIITSISKLGI